MSFILSTLLHIQKPHPSIRLSDFVCNLYAYDSEKWPLYVKQLTPLAPSFISHIFLTRRRESVLGRLSCAINLPFFVCFKGKQRLGRATKVSSQGAADRTKGRLS